MSVFLAYDGSLNGDWIARYALNLAAGSPQRRLTVLHIEDANISGTPLHQRLERLETLATRLAVETEVRILPMRDGVYGGLDEHLPQGPETLVVCGARVSAGRRGVLYGTISEQLLRAGHYNVLAIRVLQPGLLGVPRRVLLPLPANGGIAPVLPFLKPMTTGLERLDILCTVELSHRHYANLTETDAARLRRDAHVHAAAAENILTSNGIPHAIVDSHVRVTDDWPKQTAVEAGRYRSGLILVEMPPPETVSLSYAHPIEELMRNAPSDVAAYRSVTA